MNTLTKTIIAAVGAVLFTAAPAIANAERVYFLVGTRHVYRIGTYQYAHLDERKKIEEDYADQVAADQDTYNKAIAGGADPAVEGPQFNKALDDLAVDRDQRLGAMFENADYERARHPELRLEGDGPYQVIGINFHYHGDVEVFDNFLVYAPWPGYVVVDRPYGWSYGVVYTPGIFFNLYLGWHSSFFIGGGPVFFGFYGHHGPWGVLGITRGVHGGYAIGHFGHGGMGSVIGRGGSRYSSGRTLAPSRYSSGHASTGTRYNSGRTLGSSRYSTGHSTGSFSRPGSTTRSGFGSGRTTSSYSHSTSRTTTGSGSGRSSGSFSHSSSSGRSSGSYSHSSSSGGRSSGSFGRSSSGGRSSGSFGSGRSSSSSSHSSSGRSSSHGNSKGRG